MDPQRQHESSRRDSAAADSVYRVLLTDRAWPDFQIEREILASIGAEVIEAPDGDEQTLVRLAADADAIGTCWADVTRAVIDAAPRCRVVCRFGIGLDNIDVAFATQRGIPVTNHPTYCVDEVAEHALAQILSWERKTIWFDRLARAGRYQLQGGRTMHRLSTRCLGIIGFGRTGQALARRALALGLRVKIWTPSGRSHGLDVEVCASLDQLLPECDYVSVHAPLTSQTYHLVSSAAFQQMKPTALLINTSRGPLVDPAALYEALQQNRLGGAALDVFEPEPPDLNEPLYRDERVFVTPHAAFVSEESLEQLRRDVAEQICAVLRGQIPDHIVNPEYRQNQT